MLPHPTHDRLIALGLLGMAKAFEEQRQQPAAASLTFEERLGLLVDREAVERESRRLVTRLKFANLRQNATIVTGGVNPRIDGEAGAGEDKGAVEALDCLTA
jgi:hypothetical protein